MTAAILRLPAVKAATGLSRSTIYAEVSAGRMPPPIKLSPRSSGWLATEIDAFIEARARARFRGLPLP